MASFNPMQALSSGATPANDALGLNGGGQPLGMEGFDQDLNFDESMLDGVNGGGLPPLPFTPSYDFDTFFEDPFPYPSVRVYDAVVPDVENIDGDEQSPQELDNNPLLFGPPIVKAALVSDDGSLGGGGGGGQYADIGMIGELYGMFFVAEDVFGSDNSNSRPLELTCYRRNLWQCSGHITLPRNFVAVVNEQGHRVPIFDLTASITAIESIEGKPTEIISIPWKSSASSANAAVLAGGGAATVEDPKATSAPPTLPLDLAGGQELEGNRVSVPVSWKRLQFKHATANNGRRKGLQQHYVVQLNLLGRSKGGGGEVIKIAEIQSGPVIVRGRSPRNFDSRKDVPLTGGGDKRIERRGTDASASSASSSHAHAGGLGLKTEKGDLAQNIPRYHSLGNIQSGDWPTPQAVFQHQQSPHPSKKLALSPPARPPVPAWSTDMASSSSAMPSPRGHSSSRHGPATPSMGGKNCRAAGPTLPINLSLSEDERSPRRAGSGSDSLQSPRSSMALLAQQQQAAQGGAGAVESADMLYEYFPLSLDDWMSPVDAIYRPHVVHHTVLPPEVQAQQMRNKTKRYFAAE